MASFTLKSCLAASLLLTAAATFAAAADNVRFVDQRTLRLTYRIANAAPIEQAELYISRDRGRSWQMHPIEIRQPGELSLTVDADGRYDFYIVLANAGGTSAPPPTPGTEPHGRILVDTTPPLVQLHAATLESRDEGGATLMLQASLIEEHLHDRGVRLFYRTGAAGIWRDAGAIQLHGKTATASLPALIEPRCEIRLVTADLAGNRAASAIKTVVLRPEPPAEPTAAEPTVAAQSAALENAPPSPATDEPKASSAPRAATDGSETAAATAELPPAAAQLRERARRHLDEGRYELAAARLSDALGVAPQHPDLLIDLGTTLYRSEDLSGAEQNFEQALAAAPGNLDATEWLAVVAQTQKRYPEARKHLQQLLAQQPESGIFWLRFGDVEHRLGRVSDAIDAWERTLQAKETDAETRARARTRLQRIAPLAEFPLSAR